MSDTLQEQNPQPFGSEKPQRPTFLSVLCVLTFIGSGCSALSMALVGALRPILREMFESGMFEDYYSIAPTFETQMETMLAIPGFYYLLMALFYVASVVGAAMMWKMNRIGFHIYTIAQCLVLIAGMWLGNTGFSWSGLVWTALWVTAYALNFKYMKPVAGETTDRA